MKNKHLKPIETPTHTNTNNIYDTYIDM